ncbi:hypothetical protein HMPREF9094_2302 [Fusobacterium animalis ATCC 51191]|uniref:Uncharacterized protein n=1 Tax=Fusobacterium animalis ATCC 51191 TaxID=997347 RepID=F9EQU7_9FUSO|nr:hypothetical protein HMPREF9094_2302 [Fusobacterium animalis ATCC 51191]
MNSINIINLILTIIIAILGGYLADKKKVPAAYMLGALFLVAIFNVLFNRAFFPTYFKFITQIATGTFIGSKFRSEDIKMLKKVIIPGMTMVVLMIAFSFLLSYLMSTFLGIDSLTSFLQLLLVVLWIFLLLPMILRQILHRLHYCNLLD